MNRPQLPVDNVESSFIQSVMYNPYTIVSAPTGSGKSVRLGQMLDRAGFTKHGKIGISEPRRIAATSLGKYVSEEMGTLVGEQVGYNVRFEKEFGPDTRILYATEGEFMVQMATDPYFDAYNVLVIDEAHEQTVNSSLLLAQAKLACEMRPDFRVVVASATIATERFVEYLGQDKTGVIECLGTTYPVAEHFEEFDIPYHRMADFTAEKATSLIEAGKKGDILVFLPGFDDLKKATKHFMSLRADAEVLLVHGMMELKELNKLFAPHRRQRVIFSTNVAETSLTIPGVTMIIDSGLVKQSEFLPEVGIDSLMVVETSQASSLQRKGRAGRMSEGDCYFCFSKRSFQSRSKYTKPEIQRVSLAGTLLTLASLGVSDFEGYPFIDPPSSEQIEHAEMLLERIGALKMRTVTEYGKRLHSLPLDPMKGHLFLTAAKHGAVAEIVTFLAMLESRPFPRHKSDEAEPGYRQIVHEAEAWADPVSYLTIWQAYAESNFSRSWAIEQGLNWKAMEEARNVRGQLLDEASRIGLEINSPTDLNGDRLIKVLIEAEPDHLVKPYGEYSFNTPLGEGWIFPGSFSFSQTPQLLWYWEARESSKLFLHCCVPLSLKKLAELFPEDIQSEKLWPTRTSLYLSSVSVYEQTTWRGHDMGQRHLFSLPLNLAPVRITPGEEFSLTPEQWDKWLEASAEELRREEERKQEEARRRQRTRDLYDFACNSPRKKASQGELDQLLRLRRLLEERHIIRDPFTDEVVLDSRHMRWDAEKRLSQAEEILLDYNQAVELRLEEELRNSPAYRQLIAEAQENLELAVQIEFDICPHCYSRLGEEMGVRCQCLVGTSKADLGLNNGGNIAVLAELQINGETLAQLVADFTPGPQPCIRRVVGQVKEPFEGDPDKVVLMSPWS